MNGDEEELLCEGMDRFTADVPIPAGILARARRRVRRRKVAARAVLACGTADPCRGMRALPRPRWPRSRFPPTTGRTTSTTRSAAEPPPGPGTCGSAACRP